MAKSRSREGSQRYTKLIKNIFNDIIVGSSPEDKKFKELIKILDSDKIWQVLPPNKSDLLMNLKIHQGEQKYGVPEIISTIVESLIRQTEKSLAVAGTISRIHLFPKDYKKSILPDLLDIIDSQNNESLFVKLFELSCDSLKHLEDGEIERFNACSNQFFTICDYANSPLLRALKIEEVDRSKLLNACYSLINSYPKLNKFLHTILKLTLTGELDHKILSQAFVVLYKNRDNKNSINDFLSRKREYEIRVYGKISKKAFTFEKALVKILGKEKAGEVMLPMVKAGMFANAKFSSGMKKQMFAEITALKSDEKKECLKEIGDVDTNLGRAYSEKPGFLLFKGKRTKSKRFAKQAKTELIIDDAAQKALQQVYEQVEIKDSKQSSLSEAYSTSLNMSS